MLTHSLSGRSTVSGRPVFLTMMTCWSSSIYEHRHPRRRVLHTRRSRQAESLHLLPMHTPTVLSPKPKASAVHLCQFHISSSWRGLRAQDQQSCSNCLTGGHFKRQCKSVHKCKVCQKLHHTLLHIDLPNPTPPVGSQSVTPVSSNAAMNLKSNALLMICRVSVTAPDGLSVEARALLDNASLSPNDWSKFYLYLASTNKLEYPASVACRKELLSSRSPVFKSHQLELT